ncbi:MAG TPA: tetratricopeptide repeat protein, partial [Verrucomicrobiae bacterium]|nr:tetratricopeptide repeat protein [Verrucomicrobiae bacterium]
GAHPMARRFLLLAAILMPALARVALAGNPAAAPPGPVTFSEHLAPLLFRRCAPCHHPGAAGPFSLLSYQEARKRADQLADVTARRLMPPWLPEPGHGEFRDSRRLSDDEVALFQRWVKGGAVEGPAERLPAPPVFPAGWRLGPPDLIAEMPRAFLLDAEGPDVYRNFVVPLPLVSNRFVRAFEFQPGNAAIHHARVLLDTTGQAKAREAQFSSVGFAGMSVPAKFPAGHLLTWAPGRQPFAEDERFSWPLESGTDLVLQLHLQRTGKAEQVRPRVGLYFTTRAPERVPFLLGLIAQVINIPAGATNYTVTRSFILPAPVELLSVMPHAHYLGKEVELAITRPGEKPESLLLINRWDFKWQDQYRYARPVSLPAGTKVEARISYDNSDTNPRNPRHPPQLTRHGPQSTDEMGEVWLQVLPDSPAGLAALQQAYRLYGAEETVAHFEDVLSREPDQAVAHLELGKALGVLNRKEAAYDHLLRAMELNPDLVEAYHYVGIALLEQRQWQGAREAFETALKLDPAFQRSHFGLGLVADGEGKAAEAERHFARALELNPADNGARRQLEKLRAKPKP